MNVSTTLWDPLAPRWMASSVETVLRATVYAFRRSSAVRSTADHRGGTRYAGIKMGVSLGKLLEEDDALGCSVPQGGVLSSEGYDRVITCDCLNERKALAAGK